MPVRWLGLLAALGAIAGTSCLPAQWERAGATRLDPDVEHAPPVRYLADRFAVAPVTERGDTLELDLLFDTGATVALSDSARAVLAAWGVVGPAERGTSFIAQSVFERWRARHLAWRVIERADRAFGQSLPMIEVPRLAVAGHEVGPVWFTMRSTRSWRGMSAAMDRAVQGALGGSALRYFRVTVDYPNATATFERP